MTVRAKNVLADGLELPEKQRRDVAIQLLVSLDHDDCTPQEVEDSWNAEIKRRIEETDSGKVKPIPWAQAKRQIFGKSHAAAKRHNKARSRR